MTIGSWRVIAIFTLGIILAVSGCTTWSDSESESTEIIVEGQSDASTSPTEPEQPAGEITISERLAESDGEDVPAEEVDALDLESDSDEADRESQRNDNEPDAEEAETSEYNNDTVVPVSEQHTRENDDGTETVAFELPVAAAEDGVDDPTPAVSSLQIEQGPAAEEDPFVQFHLEEEPVNVRFADIDVISVEGVGSNTVAVTGNIGDEPALIVQTQPDTDACENGNQQ